MHIRHSKFMMVTAVSAAVLALAACEQEEPTPTATTRAATPTTAAVQVTSPTAATSPVATRPASPSNLPSEPGVEFNPSSVVQGRAMDLSGWGFKPGEAWVAYMSLGKDKPDAVLAGGEANDQGVIGARGVTQADAAVNLIPLSVPPGPYLVTVEGSEGTKAFTAILVLPAPTPTPRPSTPTPAATGTARPATPAAPTPTRAPGA